MRKLLKVMSVFALVVLVGLSMAACGGDNTSPEQVLSSSAEIQANSVYVAPMGQKINNIVFFYFDENCNVYGGTLTYDNIRYEGHIGLSDADISGATFNKYIYQEQGNVGWTASYIYDECLYTNLGNFEGTFNRAVMYGGTKYTYCASLQDYIIERVKEEYNMSYANPADIIEDITVDEMFQSILW